MRRETTLHIYPADLLEIDESSNCRGADKIICHGFYWGHLVGGNQVVAKLLVDADRDFKTVEFVEI